MKRQFKVGDLVAAVMYGGMTILGFVTGIRCDESDRPVLVAVTYLNPINGYTNGKWSYPFRGLDHVATHNKGVT